MGEVRGVLQGHLIQQVGRLPCKRSHLQRTVLSEQSHAIASHHTVQLIGETVQLIGERVIGEGAGRRVDTWSTAAKAPTTPSSTRLAVRVESFRHIL